MLTALPTASIIQAALWGFGPLFPFSEFFDNPGQSLIQSANTCYHGAEKVDINVLHGKSRKTYDSPPLPRAIV